MRSVESGLMAAGIGMAVNVVLAIIKIVTGIVGNSYALIADGIESTTEIVSSLVVWTGLKISTLPPRMKATRTGMAKRSQWPE
jgi:divalent metal cation (Fe/Co/Zn/Cd) transporter